MNGCRCPADVNANEVFIRVGDEMRNVLRIWSRSLKSAEQDKKDTVRTNQSPERLKLQEEALLIALHLALMSKLMRYQMQCQMKRHRDAPSFRKPPLLLGGDQSSIHSLKGSTSLSPLSALTVP